LQRPRDLHQQLDRGTLGTEDGLHTRAALPSDRCHLNDMAVRVNRKYQDDPAIGEGGATILASRRPASLNLRQSRPHKDEITIRIAIVCYKTQFRLHVGNVSRRQIL
jgi:hypothetical protein